MDGIPQRPAAVPADAVWVAEAGEWRLGAVDGQGGKQGVHRTWRADGSLREEIDFVAGRGVGPYRRFHPNGQISGQGELIDGNLQGTLRAFASDAPTPELLQSCCVPPNAWELQSDYDRGQLMARRWYDRTGQQILDSGAPHPPRPESVPADARYDEASSRWLVGTYDVRAGTRVHWRRWSREGILVEEEELLDSARHGVWRLFREPDGPLCFEAYYQHGLKHGSHRNGALAPDAYDDARASVEEGQFDADLAVGVWRLRAADGELIAERDLGVAASDQALAQSPALAPVAGALADAAAAARELADRARLLRGQRRIGESIVAGARAAALSGDAAPLRDLLRQLAWPRAAAGAAQLAVTATEQAGDRLAPLVDALVRGGDATALLRALAGALKGEYRVAQQLVDAALLLTPDHPASLVTRSLIDVHLGAPEEAARDARRLPEGWDEQRGHLSIYLRILFPTFDFWPARIAVVTMFEEFPDAPAQPLAAIRGVVAKLATRIGRIREALRRQLAAAAGAAVAGDDVVNVATDPAWLPPDLARLLPEGPATLAAWTFEQTFDPQEGDGAGDSEGNGDGAGGAPDGAGTDPQGGGEGTGTGASADVETISVDERPALEAASVPGLLRMARQEWAALTWLCWSCGLDRVALPETLAPPAEFGRAAGMSIERAWRCRDKLATGGLLAMSKGVPGFDWEGIGIDDLPRALLEVMTDEHVEVRAIFLWLCDGSAQSPWQSDLRTVD